GARGRGRARHAHGGGRLVAGGAGPSAGADRALGPGVDPANAARPAALLRRGPRWCADGGWLLLGGRLGLFRFRSHGAQIEHFRDVRQDDEPDATILLPAVVRRVRGNGIRLAEACGVQLVLVEAATATGCRLHHLQEHLASAHGREAPVVAVLAADEGLVVRVPGHLEVASAEARILTDD